MKRKTTYTHLIVLKNSRDSLSIKEFLDIALVSASYDLCSAVFFDAVVVNALQQSTDIALKQTFHMMAEFAIPLFAEVSTTLYEQPLKPVLLSQLQADSRHVLVF